MTLTKSVTREELQVVAQDCFRSEAIAATVLGNLDGFELTPEQLAC